MLKSFRNFFSSNSGNQEPLAFFDVETPNRRNASICSIGVIATDANKLLPKEKYWLVNPEEGFDPVNTGVHGLSSSDVANAMTFPQVWEDGLSCMIESHVLVAHNASFDMAVLNKTLDHYGIPFPKGTRVIDTMQLAKDLLGFGALDKCCDELGIHLGKHHDALCDARACMNVYHALCKASGGSSFEGDVYNWRTYGDLSPQASSAVTTAMTDLYGIMLGLGMDRIILEEESPAVRSWMERNSKHKLTPVFKDCYSLLESVLADGVISEAEYVAVINYVRPFVENSSYKSSTEAMQELMGILRGVAADGVISADEALGIMAWMERRAVVRENSTAMRVYNELKKAVKGHHISKADSQALLHLINQITDPLEVEIASSKQRPIVSDNSVRGVRICLTGDFSCGTRPEVEAMITAAGGTVSKGVTKKCSYVVVGDKGSDRYAYGNYGSKVQKALEYKDAGCPIEIIREIDLLDLINGEGKSLV